MGTRTNNNIVILDLNLGLGDAIICNGLVRELAKRYDSLILPCWERNLPCVSHMFSDLPNVRTMRVLDDRPLPGSLRIGINVPEFGSVEPFDRAFYHFANVDFDCRWSAFHVPDSGTEIAPPDKPFALIHEMSSGGPRELERWRISEGENLEWVTVGPRTPLITDWRLMIAAATEIHCIDSAFVHLVESVPTGAKLFFHSYARPNYFTRRKDWTVLE